MHDVAPHGYVLQNMRASFGTSSSRTPSEATIEWAAAAGNTRIHLASPSKSCAFQTKSHPATFKRAIHTVRKQHRQYAKASALELVSEGVYPQSSPCTSEDQQCNHDSSSCRLYSSIVHMGTQIEGRHRADCHKSFACSYAPAESQRLQPRRPGAF